MPKYLLFYALIEIRMWRKSDKVFFLNSNKKEFSSFEVVNFEVDKKSLIIPHLFHHFSTDLLFLFNVFLKGGITELSRPGFSLKT